MPVSVPSGSLWAMLSKWTVRGYSGIYLHLYTWLPHLMLIYLASYLAICLEIGYCRGILHGRGEGNDVLSIAWLPYCPAS